MPEGSSTITISRTGGSQDAVVTPSASGACTTSTGPLTFVGIDGAAKGVQVTTTAGGTCTISMSLPNGASANGSTSKNISVVNPAANVVLAFELGSIPPTTFGATSATVIKVRRSGGTDGAWALPIIASGVLTNVAAGTTNVSAGSTLSSLSFPANSSEASISFTPASSAPVGLSLPASGTVTLGAPTAGAGVPGGQTASVSPAGDSRTFTVSASSGCAVADNVVLGTLNAVGNPNFVSLNSGFVAAFAMPAVLPTAGSISVMQVAATSQQADIEVWYSKCPGAVNDAVRDQTQAGPFGLGSYKPCKVSLNYNGGSLSWNQTGGSASVCHLPNSAGPYYVNYRHVSISGGGNSCPFSSCANFIQVNVSQQ